MKTIRIALAALGCTLFSLAVSAQSTTPALTAYYSVKDALVATDGAKAKTSATTLVTALGTLKSGSLSPVAKKALASAKTRATALSNTSDVDTQREEFDGLSANMITLVKATKPAKAYVLFCPMAAEGKGAFWLNDQKEVRNPYYGSKMIKCGAVKEAIQ